MLNNLWTQPTHGFYVRFWLASTFTLLSFLAAGCAPEGQSVSDTCAPVGTDASDTIDFGGSVDGAAQTADVPPSAVFDIIELPTSCTSDQFSSTVGPYHLAQGLVLAQGSVWVARAYSSPGIWKYAFPKSGPISPLAYSDLPSNNFVRVLAAGADGGLYVGGFESIDLPNGKAPETERWWLAHYSASAKLVTVHYGPNVHGHRQYVRELAIRADTGVSALVTDLTEDGQLSDSIVNFSANDTVLDSLGLTQATKWHVDCTDCVWTRRHTSHGRGVFGQRGKTARGTAAMGKRQGDTAFTDRDRRYGPRGQHLPGHLAFPNHRDKGRKHGRGRCPMSLRRIVGSSLVAVDRKHFAIRTNALADVSVRRLRLGERGRTAFGTIAHRFNRLPHSRSVEPHRL